MLAPYIWILPARQRVAGPRDVYPELFALMGDRTPDLRGLFLRGYGSQVHVRNNGSAEGITSTTRSSGALGQIQGNALLPPITSGGFHHFGSGAGGARNTRGY